MNGGIINMSVRARIAAIRLIEKMEQNEVYCDKLGISNISRLNVEETGERKDQEVKSWQ